MPPPDYTFDAERLAALTRLAVLDTEPEADFDDIVEIARHVCATPVALVSLVSHDRQWFKARVGFESCETDLSRSVCAHALVEPDLLIVPDLSTDRRTRANPLVTNEPHIRFYAGAPLRTADGHVLGSLCVIDTKPRPEGLTQAQEAMLRGLGRQVVSQLELRRVLRERLALEAEGVQAYIRRNALLRLGDQLRDLRVVGDMTKAACAVVAATLNVDRVAFARFDANGDGLNVEPDWTGDGMVSIQGHHRFSDYGHDLRDGLLRGELLVIEDVEADPRTAADSQALVRIGARSLVNIPVRDRGRVVAVFVVHARQPRSWPEQVLVFLRNVADRVEIGIARSRAEAQQRILNEELGHRLKNMMAMVLALATQSLKDVPDKAPVRAFDARLRALAVAHDALIRGNWEAAELSDIVEAALEPFHLRDRFDTDGPKVRLTASATLTATMLIHELTTNAVKHGALSREGGRVALTWAVAGVQDERDLVLSWRETGGPAAAVPTRRGFGSRLIRAGLGVGTASDIKYLPDGLTATFRTRLVQIEAH